MLAELKRVCREHKLPYQAEEDRLSVIATSAYPRSLYRIRVALLKNERIGILVEFPACAKRKIENVGEFCLKVAETLSSGAHVAFDELEGHFYLYDTVEPPQLKSYVALLTQDCDILKPLFESVGQMGAGRLGYVLAFALASPESVKEWGRA